MLTLSSSSPYVSQEGWKTEDGDVRRRLVLPQLSPGLSPFLDTTGRLQRQN